jgi:hypothetical protein
MFSKALEAAGPSPCVPRERDGANIISKSRFQSGSTVQAGLEEIKLIRVREMLALARKQYNACKRRPCGAWGSIEPGIAKEPKAGFPQTMIPTANQNALMLTL